MDAEKTGSTFPEAPGRLRRRGLSPVSLNKGRLAGKILLLFLVLIQLVACAGRQALSVPLTVVHLNDTHSHLEPLSLDLTLHEIKTTVEIGGFPRIKTVLDGMRANDPDLLLLHAGDAVQGTPYFQRFRGTVEFDSLNRLGVDAMTFGNHEFDGGTEPIANWIRLSRFPLLSANIDFSGERTIAPLVQPFLVREVQGEKVGIIGLTTEDTPQIVRDPGRTVFRDAFVSARIQVERLTSLGVRRVIVLSHLGYRQDVALASRVSGIDIIVGGHSHSLLMDGEGIRALGRLVPDGPYPTEVTAPDGKKVLVLQAWQWGHAIGMVRVHFSPEGDVAHHEGRITIPLGDRFVQKGSTVPPHSAPYRRIVKTLEDSGVARIVPEDEGMLKWLQPYAREILAFRTTMVATATEEIVRGLNGGPGPLAADSMLAAFPGTRVALLNSGAVRRDLKAGRVSVGDVMEVLPFANTLVLLDLTGAELKAALEEYTAFLLRRFPDQAIPPAPYVAGITFSLRPGAPEGKRVCDLSVRDASGTYKAMDPQAVYRTVVNAFMAGGGDHFKTLKAATAFRVDTGMIDQEVFREHLKRLGSFGNPTERRITILP